MLTVKAESQDGEMTTKSDVHEVQRQTGETHGEICQKAMPEVNCVTNSPTSSFSLGSR